MRNHLLGVMSNGVSLLICESSIKTFRARTGRLKGIRHVRGSTETLARSIKYPALNHGRTHAMSEAREESDFSEAVRSTPAAPCIRIVDSRMSFSIGPQSDQALSMAGTTHVFTANVGKMIRTSNSFL
jgi:hypothetical protein